MPYRKYNRPYRRRRYYRKPPQKPMRYKVADTAYKAYVMGRKAMRIINSEVKVSNTSSSYSPSSTGAVVDLSSVAQGDTDNTRDGDSIKPLNLTMRGLISADASVTNNGATFVRVVVVRAKHERGTSPTWASVFGSASTLAAKDHDNRFETKILYDRLFSLDANKGSTLTFNKIIKLDGHIQFDGGASTIRNGGIYLMHMSNVATNLPSLNVNTRLSFVDN